MPKKKRKQRRRPNTQVATENTIWGIRNVALPVDLAQHELVAKRWFYAFPAGLWDSLRDVIGYWEMSSELVQLDMILAKHADSIGGCVGFHDGLPIHDFLLRPAPSGNNGLTADYLEECRNAGYDVSGFGKLNNETIPDLEQPRQAYLGWLFTSPLFLAEFRRLQEEHSDLFSASEVPPQPIALPVATKSDSVPKEFKPEENATSRAVRDFCERWRLSRIVGPATLAPLSLQFPVPLPMVSAVQAQTSGSLLYIPDITPLPDRNTLRQLLGQTVSQTTRHAPHLKEWFDLVEHDTQGKKSIAKFARWYPLQHYLRVLYSRHAELFKNRQGKAGSAIRGHLKLTEDQLRTDLRQIRERLGPDWFRPDAATGDAS